MVKIWDLTFVKLVRTKTPFLWKQPEKKNPINLALACKITIESDTRSWRAQTRQNNRVDANFENFAKTEKNEILFKTRVAVVALKKRKKITNCKIFHDV